MTERNEAMPAEELAENYLHLALAPAREVEPDGHPEPDPEPKPERQPEGDPANSEPDLLAEMRSLEARMEAVAAMIRMQPTSPQMPAEQDVLPASSAPTAQPEPPEVEPAPEPAAGGSAVLPELQPAPGREIEMPSRRPGLVYVAGSLFLIAVGLCAIAAAALHVMGYI